MKELSKIGFVKCYDKDLKLYLELIETIKDYLECLKRVKGLSNSEFLKERRKLSILMNQLQKRLQIQTIKRFL